MDLREFENGDWYAWAGVESVDPLIGESEELTCIVDGPALGLYRINDRCDTLGCETYTLVETPCRGTAMLVAMGLRGNESAEELESLRKQWGF